MRVIRAANMRLRAKAPLRAAVLLLLLVLNDAPAAADDPAAAIRDTLAAGAPPVTDIDAALGAGALAALKQVYTARDERPIWPEREGRALIARLSQPDMTIGPKLQPLLADAHKRLDAKDPGADLLLTALYGATAKVLRPDAPAAFKDALAALARADDLAALLRPPEPPKVEAVPPEVPKAEPPKVETPKVETPPEPPAIARLRAAIAALQSASWPQVPDGPKLQLGDFGARVEALSRRLIASGDSKATLPGEEFDLPLKTALQHFQARHGLPADGVAGAATIAALNVSVKDRLAALNANLQRQVRSGADWGERYLVVNLAGATYRLIESGSTRAEGPVILGASATPTPMLDGSIDRIALRPSYRIPQSIADRELWPRQEEDALYFTDHGIRVTDDGLRQGPGAGNPLGLAKLLIAGNDRIALHGTSNGPQAQAAFDLPDRHTSLGCVALPDIVAVARPLLAADPAWTEGRIAGALAAGGSETITLAKPLPVHFVYQTAWVDEDGTLEFRDDVYGWVKQLPTAAPNPIADPCGS